MATRMASRKQLFRLYRDTGQCLELRNIQDFPISTASMMISRIVDGTDPNVIKDELIKMGATLKESADKVPVKMKPDYQKIYLEACAHGMKVAKEQEAEQKFHGSCGFGWIQFKGNTAWGRWAKKNSLTSPAHPSGLMIWVSHFNQSESLKYAYAVGFAKVLREHGIDADARSRAD